MVDEGEGIITSPNCSMDELGRLLHETWKIKKGLTTQISNPELDSIYDAGLDAGALGGKLLGAGGGGFMLFYVRPERRAALRRRLKHLLCIPFTFSDRGSHVVVYEPEEIFDKSLKSERSQAYATQAS